MNPTYYLTLFEGSVLIRIARALLFAFCAASLVACGSGGGGGGGASGASAVAPIIAIPPVPASVRDGLSATFSVSAAGTGLGYQWQRDGVAIPGATAATYAIPVTQLSDNGASFAVVVSNAAGSVQSAPAILTVSPVAPSLASNTPTTVSVLEGQTATFSVSTSGSSPLVFQWRRGGAPIAGANTSSFTTPPTRLADNGAVFDIVITNVAGSITSAPFTLNVTSVVVAPTITTQPAAQTVRVGAPVTFAVASAGTAPFSYQWLRDGNPIAGAQASTYTIASTAQSDNGAQVSVRVANSAGTITSASVLLTVLPQPGVALLAGNIGGPGNRDGAGQAASFNQPDGLAIDNAGNLYVGDFSNHLLRKVNPAGLVTTLAGSPGISGSADGVGGAARFNFLHGVAVDSSGNVFVADTNNSTIRKVATDGTVTTLAGSPAVTGSTDGAGASASFNLPTGVAIDAAGNVYVADSGNHTIRKITTGGVVTTIAGTAGRSGFADGTGAAAVFFTPSGLAADAAGNLFVTDTNNNVIRKITPAGVVTTLAGTPGTRGSSDGPGSSATFAGPTAVASDAAGNLYVTDYISNIIRKVTPAGVVTTLAGAAGLSGSSEGAGSNARFSSPAAIAVDASGIVYVADSGNSAIRRIDAGAVVTTIAGSAAVRGTTDATGSAALFNSPRAVATDAVGNVYVADTANNMIRKITSGGVTTTLAGSRGAGGSVDGVGAAARFNVPAALAVDGSGNVIVADFANNTIRKITPAGVVTTLAGTAGVPGAANGVGAAATFAGPVAVTIDSAGNIYVADSGNQLIRKVTAAGNVTTFAGVAGQAGSADGAAASATFRGPSGVAVDAAGNVYVGDSGNDTIRRIDTRGVATTVAGTVGRVGSSDGAGSAALFSNPTGVVADAGGNVYVADSDNGTIRQITPAGVVTTVAGVADGRSGVQTGALPARLLSPFQIAIDAAGNLYSTSANGVLRITLR